MRHSIGQRPLILDRLRVKPVAAHSLRRLIRKYTGPACRLRRASDDVEQDFGFEGDGLDKTAVNAFLSGTTGYVVKVYDQMGSANHLVQPTAANQPAFSLTYFNGCPGWSHDGVGTYLTCDGLVSVFNGTDVPFSQFVTAQNVNPTIAGGVVHAGSSTNTQYSETIAIVTNKWRSFRRGSTSSPNAPILSTFDADQHAHVHARVFRGTTLDWWLDDTVISSEGAYDVGAISVNHYTVGGTFRSALDAAFQGMINEHILFNVALTAEDANALRFDMCRAYETLPIYCPDYGPQAQPGETLLWKFVGNRGGVAHANYDQNFSGDRNYDAGGALGMGGVRLRVPAGDGTNVRCQLIPNPLRSNSTYVEANGFSLKIGQTYRIVIDTCILEPTDVDPTGNFSLLWQIHDIPDSGETNRRSPMVALGLVGGQNSNPECYQLDVRSETVKTATVDGFGNPNSYAHEDHYRFDGSDTDPTGATLPYLDYRLDVGKFVRWELIVKLGYQDVTGNDLWLWRNGVLILERLARGNCYNDDVGPYFDYGPYVGHTNASVDYDIVCANIAIFGR